MRKLSEMELNVLQVFQDRMARRIGTLSSVVAYEQGLLGVKVTTISPLGDTEELFYSLKSIMDPINRLVTVQERSRLNAFRQ
jgi:hypothetical protein